MVVRLDFSAGKQGGVEPTEDGAPTPPAGRTSAYPRARRAACCRRGLPSLRQATTLAAAERSRQGCRDASAWRRRYVSTS